MSKYELSNNFGLIKKGNFYFSIATAVEKLNDYKKKNENLVDSLRYIKKHIEVVWGKEDPRMSATWIIVNKFIKEADSTGKTRGENNETKI